MGLSRTLKRLTRSAEAHEQDELRETLDELGGTPIDQVEDKCVTECCGTVRSVSLRPRQDDVPALVVDLDDGHRTMNLVWLGRRTIAGIEPGVFLKVKGRVLFKKGVPTIYNPSYEIKPVAHKG